MFRDNKKNLNRKKLNIKTLPPPPSYNINLPQQNLPQQNSILNTLKDGFSFGVGSSIGNRVVNGILSDKKEENINDKKEVIINSKIEKINDPDLLFKKYIDCIENNKKDNDISECLKILEKNKIDF
jgi:hypothetical protein